MQIIRCEAEQFDREAVTTEALAYEQLCRRPLTTEMAYLAVPWACLLNGDWDRYRKRLRKLRTGSSFTVCQHIDYRFILPVCERIGVDVLFTPHVEPDARQVPIRWKARVRRLADGLRHGKLVRGGSIAVLPFPHAAVNGIEPAAEKDLWYSFIGFDTHACRRPLFALRERTDTVIKERVRWHFEGSAEEQRREKDEYQDVLARSRFSLCPRGTGPSTIRFWESLQAGAIPVLIADTMTLPPGIAWEDCVIRVAESEAHRVEEILQSVAPDREAAMRAACLRAFTESSGEQFVRPIRDALGQAGRAAA